jgi:hypothetical protein
MKTSSLLPLLALTATLAIHHASHAAENPAPANASPAPLIECQPRGGLPNFLGKLQRGGEVRIGYLGGSITAQDGWRPKTLRWVQEQFTNARLREINAAIGGTGSDLGVFRLHQDVLAHRPDLLFVEFAVNDAGASPEQIHRCMEGIVRQTWQANPATDLCFVYTLANDMFQTYLAGKLPRSVTAMETLAAHYAIPTINFGPSVAALQKEGRLVFTGPKPKTDAEKSALGDRILFSPDSVHPYTDTGHQLYLDALTRSWPQLRGAGQTGSHALGAPLVANHFAAAKLVPLDRARLSPGWHKLDPTNSMARRFGKQLPQLWKANQPGDTLTFKFKGTAVGIYDVIGPDCGQIIATLDDKPARVVPRFDAYCTYHRLATLMLATGLPDAEHVVKLEIHPDQPDKVMILQKRNEKMDDPKRFDGRAWYAGSLMLIGDLAE